MRTLNNLGRHQRKKNVRRVGRGTGCKKGKTCGRGVKGDKARSGYKTRAGKEGGQVPLFQRLPTRGFTRGRFKEHQFSINLATIEEKFEDGDTVNVESLINKGFSKPKMKNGVKILSVGTLTKKVTVEASAMSKRAMEKLEEAGVEFKIVK
ncbi:MAG: 50S ribosomal protein L15 [Simkaniaceae bacterium]|nr:50S ribosomal protein L15 [Simkaniaceae bacterium]